MKSRNLGGVTSGAHHASASSHRLPEPTAISACAGCPRPSGCELTARTSTADGGATRPYPASSLRPSSHCRSQRCRAPPNRASVLYCCCSPMPCTNRTPRSNRSGWAPPSPAGGVIADPPSPGLLPPGRYGRSDGSAQCPRHTAAVTSITSRWCRPLLRWRGGGARLATGGVAAILAYAVLLGVGQHLCTRFVDRRAETVLNSLPSKENPSPTGERQTTKRKETRDAVHA